MQEVIAGAPSEKNMTVTLLDSQQNPAPVWAFKNAFPHKVDRPALNSLSNDFATETLEIAHSGFHNNRAVRGNWRSRFSPT